MGARTRAIRLVVVLAVIAPAGCSTDLPEPNGPTAPSWSTASTTSPPSSGSPPSSPTPSSASTAPTRTPSPSPSPTRTTTPSPTPTRTPTPSPTPTPTPTPSPAATLPAALAGRIVTTIPTTRRIVALTFDAGASAAGVASITATLAEHGVPATFLPTGAFARKYPDAVRTLAAAGHRIGNHSDTHPDFTALTSTQQQAQLVAAESAIRPLAGRSTQPWFRFPFGASTPGAIRGANAQGYACIGWTVDTLGWKGTSGGQSVASVLDRVLSTLRPGQVVLMHVGANPDDGSTLDADALPSIISALRDQGYEFVTLDAALG